MRIRLTLFSLVAMLLLLTAASGQVILTTYTTTAMLTSPCSQVVQLPKITSSTTVSAICSATVPITYTSTSTVTTSTSSTFANGASYYWDGQSSPSIVNSGVYGIISVGTQTFGNGYGGCLSFWVAENSFKSGAWGQVGYVVCNGGIAQAFYQIWNVTTGAILSANTIPVSVGNHNFSMYNTGGTTWTYALDKVPFGSYDMLSNVPTTKEPMFALSEQGEVASPQHFANTVFVSAMNEKIGGIWVQPKTTIYAPGSPWTQTSLGTDSFEVSY